MNQIRPPEREEFIKIVADENIPHVHHYFGDYGSIILKPGRAITRADLIDADILLVRSITAVNQHLLQHTSVKFVGSATTGTDHIDSSWLEKNKIQWANAKGCNATAVVEYVLAVVAVLQTQVFLKEHVKAGVIGVGEIGSQVVAALKKLDFSVIQCDPPRAQADPDFMSTPLEEMVDLDFITLHTPLNLSEPFSTFHLIKKNFLRRQKEGCFLLNTGRGSAIHFDDLKKYGKHLHWCLDVWENEPDIDLDVMQHAVIATPHIAGYSVQSKYRGIQMLYQAAVNQGIIPHDDIAPLPFPKKEFQFDKKATWQEKILQIYNPLQTSEEMKWGLLTHQTDFDSLRKNFPERYEFNYTKI